MSLSDPYTVVFRPATIHDLRPNTAEATSAMLSVEDARLIVLEHSSPLPPQQASLSPAALGRPLAEVVRSDQDVPAFTKSLMDGFAVRAADLASGRATLAVIEEVTAGRVPTRPIGPGQATRIMTGAPMPEGADAVIPVETCREAGAHVEIEGPAPTPGLNLLPRGREMRQGEEILPVGAPLTAQALGVLATCGWARVLIVPPPRVAITATGDELVEPSAVPGPGQVRNSNAPMLAAQVALAGGSPRDLGIARDTAESLRAAVREGLETSDVLILSGGVSAGKLDLVPGILREEGVTTQFHKVRLKPGKPLFFGTAERPGGTRLVFGLPGNPVSSFVCFELFVRPALRRLGGHREVDLPAVSATLAADFACQSDRPTYHPAHLTAGPGGWEALALEWFGSADLRAFLGANALLVFPPGGHSLRAGERVQALRLGA